MKKGLCVALVLFLYFLLAGCGNASSFKGVILSVKTSSIVVGTRNVDPDASYPPYEVIVDDTTEISGKVNDFSDLEEEQKVDIWVKNEGEGDNNKIDFKVAAKIVVK